MTADAQRCPGYSRYKLISFQEVMKRLNVAHLFGLAGKLGLLEASLGQSSAAAGCPHRVVPAPAHPRVPIRVPVPRLPETAEQIAKRVQREMPAHPTTTELEGIVRELRRVMEAELAAPLFLWIPGYLAHYFAEDASSVAMIGVDFLEATGDFIHAGRCLACGQATACVFHLMRVVESGLRAITTRVGVSIDLEEASWNKVLNTLEKEGPASPVWQAAPEFYQGMLVHLRQIKNAYRNPTMHVRGHYDEWEAESLHNLVFSFMRSLGSGMAGQGQT